MADDFSRRLDREMFTLGLTDRGLAKLAGVSPSTINRARRGDTEPGPGTVGKILDALGVDADWNRNAQPAAIAAARLLCGDDIPVNDDVERWIGRFELLGDPTVPERMMWRAARYAPLRRRVAATGSVDNYSEFVDAAEGTNWAWTSNVVASAILWGCWQIPEVCVYVDKPELIEQRIGPENGRSIPVLMVRSDDLNTAGVRVGEDGTASAAQLQIAMDCLAGGRPEVGWWLLDRMGYPNL